MFKHRRLEPVLALVFVVLWSVVWKWQNPNNPLSTSEVSAYMAQLEQLPLPPDERTELLNSAKSWMETDDGKPVYMLNLMRFFPELQHYAGGPTDVHMTPEQSNQLYEDTVIPILAKLGGYPLYFGNIPGKNLIVHDAGLDDWNRTLVVRYPERRAFMQLITNPEYIKVLPYKLMSVKVVLTPTVREIAVPEITWALGAIFLIVWLLVAWRRAVRRQAAAS